MAITIGLVDDHVMLRNGLAALLRELDYAVAIEADNGKQLSEKLASGGVIPDVVLLDINMPVMDGYDTCLWLKQQHPGIKVLALSMYDDETSIIRMLKNGAKGYILKDSDPSELNAAIQSVIKKGYYHSELVSAKMIHSINHLDDAQGSNLRGVLTITEREREFLKLLCTEMTYKEIAEKMNLSLRTVDGYREALFQRLDLKSRVGLVLFAIKNHIVKI